MSNSSKSISNPLNDSYARPMTALEEKESEKISESAFTRPKYLKAQKSMTRLKIHQLHVSNPDWELKDILAAIIKEYPADMPPPVISTMVQFIIGEWEKLVVPEEVA